MADLRNHIRVVSEVTPSSDVRNALALYEGKFAAALERAMRIQRYVSSGIAAEILDKSVSEVTYLCRTGAIAAKKVGNKWTVDLHDLMARGKARQGQQQDYAA